LGLRSNLEEPVYEADLVVDALLAGEAVTSADHPHDLEALDRSACCLHRLEAACGPDHPLECTMICFNDVVQYFDVRWFVSYAS